MVIQDEAIRKDGGGDFNGFNAGTRRMNGKTFQAEQPGQHFERLLKIFSYKYSVANS